MHGEAKAASQVEEVVGESAEGGSEKLADATLPSDTMDRDIQDTMEEEMRSAEESSREGSLRELQKDLEEAAVSRSFCRAVGD